jgi:periplasmic protein TonB
MKTDLILKSDVLDIIFENKNKLYGAYTLRKFYNNRMYKALGAMFGLVAIVCLCSFIGKEKENFTVKIMDETPTLAAPKKDIKKVEPPKITIPEHRTSSTRVNTPTQVYQVPIITNTTVTTRVNDLIDGTQFGDVDNKGKTGKDPIVTLDLPLALDTIAGGIAEPVKKPIDKLTPNLTAEIMPAFPGGVDALRKFLQKNLQNPTEVTEGEDISVKIKFVVGFDGKLKGFETIEDGGDAFNKEVIRVLKKMPDWVPGKSRGESISVYYTIPVKFTSVTE